MLRYSYQFHAESRMWQNREIDLVLRLSTPRFSPNSGGIACWVTELNAAFFLDVKGKKLKKIDGP